MTSATDRIKVDGSSLTNLTSNLNMTVLKICFANGNRKF